MYGTLGEGELWKERKMDGKSHDYHYNYGVVHVSHQFHQKELHTFSYLHRKKILVYVVNTAPFGQTLDEVYGKIQAAALHYNWLKRGSNKPKINITLQCHVSKSLFPSWCTGSKRSVTDTCRSTG